MADSVGLGDLVVTMVVNTSGLQKGVTDMQRFKDGVESNLRSMNSSLSFAANNVQRFAMMWGRYISLPITAIGVGAVKMASELEFTQQKIVALAGVSQSTMNAWAMDVKRISSETARSSKEIADALYYTASAGLKGAEALEVVETAARAAATGLGKTDDVARVLSYSLNAYGKANLSAAYAGDVLVAAVREGTAEADQFANHIGMVIPVAADLGVSFDQVAGTMANLTKTGFNASMAATSLRQILASLIHPAHQSQDALKAMGTSAGELRKELRDRGLMETLFHLNELTNKYGEEVVGTVFPNVRALTGVLSLLNQNMDEVRRVQDSVTNTTNDLGKAFAVMSETSTMALRRVKVSFENNLLTLGKSILDAIVPALRDFAGWMNNLAVSFATLSPHNQRTIINFGLFLASIYPITIALGLAMRTVIMFRGSVLALSSTMISSSLLMKLGFTQFGFATARLVPILHVLRSAILAVNTAILANPWTALISVLAAVAGYFMYASLTADKLSESQRKLSDIQIQARQSVSAERYEIEKLTNIINSEYTSKEQKIEAIKTLNEISPKYLGYITEETAQTDAAKKSIDLYLGSLERSNELKIIASSIQEAQNKRISDLATGQDKKVNWLDWYKQTAGNFNYGDFFDFDKAKENAAQQSLMKFKDNMEALTSRRDELSFSVNANDLTRNYDFITNAIKGVEKASMDQLNSLQRDITSQMQATKNLYNFQQEGVNNKLKSDKEYLSLRAELEKVNGIQLTKNLSKDEMDRLNMRKAFLLQQLKHKQDAVEAEFKIDSDAMYQQAVALDNYYETIQTQKEKLTKAVTVKEDLIKDIEAINKVSENYKKEIYSLDVRTQALSGTLTENGRAFDLTADYIKAAETALQGYLDLKLPVTDPKVQNLLKIIQEYGNTAGYVKRQIKELNLELGQINSKVAQSGGAYDGISDSISAYEKALSTVDSTQNSAGKDVDDLRTKLYALYNQLITANLDKALSLIATQTNVMGGNFNAAEAKANTLTEALKEMVAQLEAAKRAGKWEAAGELQLKIDITQAKIGLEQADGLTKNYMDSLQLANIAAQQNGEGYDVWGDKLQANQSYINGLNKTITNLQNSGKDFVAVQNLLNDALDDRKFYQMAAAAWDYAQGLRAAYADQQVGGKSFDIKKRVNDEYIKKLQTEQSILYNSGDFEGAAKKGQEIEMAAKINIDNQDAHKIETFAKNVLKVANLVQGSLSSLMQTYIGFITVQQNQALAAVEKIAKEQNKSDKWLEREKEKINAEAARKKKAVAVSEAIMNTAVAVVGALGNKPWGPWNFALAALVGAAGMAQVALIRATPMAQGGIVPMGYGNDTYPAMLTSGEAVVPPGKLETFLNQYTSNMNTTNMANRAVSAISNYANTAYSNYAGDVYSNVVNNSYSNTTPTYINNTYSNLTNKTEEFSNPSYINNNNYSYLTNKTEEIFSNPNYINNTYSNLTNKLEEVYSSPNYVSNVFESVDQRLYESDSSNKLSIINQNQNKESFIGGSPVTNQYVDNSYLEMATLLRGMNISNAINPSAISSVANTNISDLSKIINTKALTNIMDTTNTSYGNVLNSGTGYSNALTSNTSFLNVSKSNNAYASILNSVGNLLNPGSNTTNNQAFENTITRTAIANLTDNAILSNMPNISNLSTLVNTAVEKKDMLNTTNNANYFDKAYESVANTYNVSDVFSSSNLSRNDYTNVNNANLANTTSDSRNNLVNSLQTTSIYDEINANTSNLSRYGLSTMGDILTNNNANSNYSAISNILSASNVANSAGSNYSIQNSNVNALSGRSSDIRNISDMTDIFTTIDNKVSNLTNVKNTSDKTNQVYSNVSNMVGAYTPTNYDISSSLSNISNMFGLLNTSTSSNETNLFSPNNVSNQTYSNLLNTSELSTQAYTNLANVSNKVYSNLSEISNKAFENISNVTSLSNNAFANTQDIANISNIAAVTNRSDFSDISTMDNSLNLNKMVGSNAIMYKSYLESPDTTNVSNLSNLYNSRFEEIANQTNQTYSNLSSILNAPSTLNTSDIKISGDILATNKILNTLNQVSNSAETNNSNVLEASNKAFSNVSSVSNVSEIANKAITNMASIAPIQMASNTSELVNVVNTSEVLNKTYSDMYGIPEQKNFVAGNFNTANNIYSNPIYTSKQENSVGSKSNVLNDVYSNAIENRFNENAISNSYAKNIDYTNLNSPILSNLSNSAIYQNTIATSSSKGISNIVNTSLDNYNSLSDRTFNISNMLSSIDMFNQIDKKSELKIPKLANGGIIPSGYPNDTYPAYLTSGEMVVPPGRLDYQKIDIGNLPERKFKPLKFKIEGRDLVAVLEEMETLNKSY